MIRSLRALTGALLACCVLAAFAPAFGRTATEALWLPAFGAVGVGAAGLVAVVGIGLAAGTRCAPVTRLVAELAVLATYVLLVVAPGRDALAGPRRLLTTALPIEASGPELATVVALVGLTAIGAVEPALRRRAALLPLIAPLLAVAAGCAVSASAGTPTAALAPAVALGAGVLCLTARYGPRRVGAASLPRRAVAVAAVLLVLAGLAVAGRSGPTALAATGRDSAVDARRLVPQPVQPRRADSPLTLYPALRTGRLRLALTVTAARRPDRLRYATLTEFNGAYWTTGARYQRAGRRLPLATDAAPGRQETDTVRVDDPGPLGWLLSAGRPVEVSVPGMGVDADTGDVVVPADRPVPADYTVRSAVPRVDPDELAAASPVPLAAADGAIGTPAPDLARQAGSLVAGADYGDAALATLAAHFRTDGGFGVDRTGQPPAGHGLFQIRRLLTSRRGTAEQYASAFAVLARLLGYQSRVVVGFVPRATDRPGEYQVTNTDVDAWPEIRFAGLGWVRYAVTPGRTAGAAPAPPPSATPSPHPTTGARAGAPPAAAAPATPAAHPTRGRPAALLVVVAALLVLLLAAAPVLKAARRRTRSRAPDPRDRTAGAWRDLVEALGQAGVRWPPGTTAGGVAAVAAERFGPTVAGPADELAALHDAALFAPAAVTDAHADLAWRHAGDARRAVRARLSPPRRLRALFDPRPLLRRAPTRRAPLPDAART